MKKIFKKISVIMLILFVFIINTSIVFADSDNKLDLVSKAAILIDTKTGKVLFGKNENAKMYPASITKIVTAIITIENCNLDDEITVSYDAAMSIPEGYSTAYLQIGEKLTVEQLLELLLVHSANDAANVLAEEVGGSVESFVSMMNTKIADLGLKNTHFTNTFGMHDENHYTTASDLASIMKYCIKNENFRRLAGKASCAIPATNMYGTRKYSSTNELIIPTNKNYYKYLTCGKTGYTTQAGDCLVSCAYNGNLELISVILGGKNVDGTSTRFSETKKLYEYGYTNYEEKTIIKENDVITNIEISNATNETKNLDLLAKTDISALIKTSTNEESLKPEITLKEELKAPIEENEILGYATYNIEGLTYKTDLIASHPVEKSKIIEITIEVCVAIIILIIIYKIIIRKNNKKQKGQ